MEAGEGERFACVDCGRRCGREDDIRRHLELECGTRPRVECPECPFRTIWEEVLESHWMRKHEDQGPAFVCTGCGEGFSSAADVTTHLKCNCPRLPPVSKRRILCPKCGRVCIKNGFLRHFNSCSGQPKFYKCLACPYQSASKNLLSLHTRRRHGPEILTIFNHQVAHNKNFTCLDCDRMYGTKPELENHLLERCATEAKAECPVCFKRLYNRRIRWTHIRRAHGEESLLKYRTHKPFKCAQCGKPAKSKNALATHQKLVCGKSPAHSCPDCPYKAHDLKRLKGHIKRMHGETGLKKLASQSKAKPYQCNKCHRGFVYQPYFTIHVSVCGQPPTRQCPECPYITHLAPTLREHIKTQHGVNTFERIKLQRKLNMRANKPFPCPQCEGAYSRKQGLLKHLKNDCGKVDQCPECPAVLKHQCLRTHILVKHGRSALAKNSPPVEDKPYKCARCGRGYKSPQSFKNHFSYCK